MAGPDIRDYTRESFEVMAGIPESVKVIDRQVSKIDGTIKLLFRFQDGETAESVVLFNKKRASACISSQSGCACGCGFCATGGLGFKRDLTPAEITGQFAACLRSAGGALNNVVFMGMGEPFLNWENVKKSILMLSDNKGYNFPQTKITVSTVGIVPVIRELAQSDLKIKLAISIITADEKQRAELVPMDAKYPLREIIASARYYCARKAKPVFFEYILFRGLNDSPWDAVKLLDLVKGIECKINLILYNKSEGKVFGGCGPGEAKEFQKIIMAQGVRTYLRKEKGSDIGAACGQLAGIAAMAASHRL